MTDIPPIQRAAEILSDLASGLKTLSKEVEVVNAGLQHFYLAQYRIHVIHQVKAICILVGNEEAPYYSEQAGQLVRGLCETWAKVAWMMEPDEETERIDRAWRLYKYQVKKAREKIEYKQLTLRKPNSRI